MYQNQWQFTIYSIFLAIKTDFIIQIFVICTNFRSVLSTQSALSVKNAAQLLSIRKQEKKNSWNRNWKSFLLKKSFDIFWNSWRLWQLIYLQVINTIMFSDSKTVGITVGLGAAAFLGYCIYFDHKRRSAPDFKDKLKVKLVS